MKLSIIIVNFNTYKYLSQCLDSIYYSNFNCDQYEIIVVDNASTDGSALKISKNYPNVRLIRNSVNTGFSKANNRAVKSARGQYVLFLNPDTIVQRNTIDALLKYMEENLNSGVVTCRLELPDGTLDDACHRGFPTPLSSIFYFSGLSSLFPKSRFFNSYHLGYRDMDRIHEIESCSGACMLVRFKAGNSINWFDEDYFWYGEDLDFCFRIKEKKWKVIYIPYVKITHYKGIASGIKKHSKKMSFASDKTKLIATRARFEVMRIFYKKHYQNRYPRWLTFIVFTGIKLKEQFTRFLN